MARPLGLKLITGVSGRGELHNKLVMTPRVRREVDEQVVRDQTVLPSDYEDDKTEK